MKRPPSPPSWHTSLTTIGVTGTNGKTTTTTYAAAALAALGKPVPRATTIGKFLGDEQLDVPEGYPGFLETMRRGIAAGAGYAAAEYTSEALAAGFALAWPSTVGVFTNLTRDHMNAHATAEHYLASKAQLFAHLLPGGAAVLNACDPAGALLAEIVPAGRRVVTYAAPSRGQAWCSPTVRLSSAQVTPDGTKLELAWAEDVVDAPPRVVLRAAGEVFAENAMAALLAAHAAGVPLHAAADAIAAAPSPPGRFEIVSRAPCVVVDYAHTPDALLRTVATARTLAASTGGAVTVIFGAGGDRDAGKRPQMGAAATKADTVVLTTDNPRSERPEAIAAAIRGGIGAGPDVVVELDRRRAIERAIHAAKAGDVVVVAGKGHERGQIVGDTVHPFSDVEVVRTACTVR